MRFALLAVTVSLSSCMFLEGVSDDRLPEFQGCPVESYTFGQELEGDLEDTDCRLQGDRSRRVDFYELRVYNTIDEARIRVGSGVIDPYLFLYERNGTLLDEHDDITPILNDAARVQMRLEPGQYILGVSSSAGGDYGRYELTSVRAD